MYSPAMPLDREERVLLVDDDLDLCEALAEGLAREGIRAAYATSAQAALLRLTAAPEIDIVVTDLVMPQIGGLEFLRKLSITRSRWPFAAIVMTGSPSVESAVTALRLFAIDFLQKPVEAKEVANAVRSAADHLQKSVPTMLPRPSTVTLTSPDMLAGLLRLQEERKAVFPSSVLNETCWNMLLHLAAVELEGRILTSVELYSVPGATPTTSFRKLDDLVAAGLVSRTEDLEDRRRVTVRLTPKGSQQIRAIIERMLGHGG